MHNSIKEISVVYCFMMVCSIKDVKLLIILSELFYCCVASLPQVKGKRRIGMKVLRWGVCALAALLMTAGSSFANDSDIDAMKSAMDNMKQEMDAMRATMSAEREAMRESAGGAPEALRSKGGNATVRIGGKVAVRYRAEFSSNENAQGAEAPMGGEYATKTGWEMDTASVTFDFQINEDLSAFIDVRPTKFDKAYFQWNNIGGTGLGTQVGWIGVPCGMYDASWSPNGDVLMYNPATKSNLLTAANTPTAPGISTDDDLTAMGVKLYYELDQFKITGTVYNNALGNTNDDESVTTALASDGVSRNYGINHSIMLEYSPAFLEGLHFSFTYVGDVDFGQGESWSDNPAWVSGTWTEHPAANTDNDSGRGTAYSPTFDLGVAYVADKFAVWATADYTINPGYYAQSWGWNLSVGANYNITERLAVAGAFDMSQYGSSNAQLKGTAASDYVNAAGYRAQVGAKYTFCNGVWVKANYAHTWLTYEQGVTSTDNEWTRGRDEFVFETGVAF